MGELRDAIARAFYESDDTYISPWDDQDHRVRDWYHDRADAALAALRDTLSSKPECITELGWYRIDSDAWRTPAFAPTQVEREAQ